MASLGHMCEKDIDEQRLKINSFISSTFRRSMDSLLERAQVTAQSQVELANMKADLREAEDELVKALAQPQSILCWEDFTKRLIPKRMYLRAGLEVLRRIIPVKKVMDSAFHKNNLSISI